MDSHEIDKLGEEIYDNYKPLFDSDDLCLLSTMRYDPSLSETEPIEVHGRLLQKTKKHKLDV